MKRFLRVDFRLLHGQVGMSWCPYLGANCLLIANDHVLTDPIMLASVKLAKPGNVKLVIKGIDDSIKALTSGVADKYNLFIVVDSIHDAWKILKATGHKQLNIGATRFKKGDRQLLDGFYVDEEDIQELKEMIELGITVEQQMIPSKTITPVQKLL